MGFFSALFGDHSEDDHVKEAREQRQAASQQAIVAGGLPLQAQERLKEQATRQNSPQHFWTSDLSVNELALTRNAGYEALGQVMGSSVYHVGMQWTSQTWSNSYMRGGGSSFELDVITAAYAKARHLSLSRLLQEASLLGATGVVGVRLEQTSIGWAEDLVEFTAIGTAVREPNMPHRADQWPFLCSLSGLEFWALRQGGYRPLGLVAGNCTYYCIPNWSTQNAVSGGWFGAGSSRNQELSDYTQAVYQARELGMGRLEREVRAFKAEGCIGMVVDTNLETRDVEINNSTRVDVIFHFQALGTAIQKFDRPAPLGIMPILPLQNI